MLSLGAVGRAEFLVSHQPLEVMVEAMLNAEACGVDGGL